MSKGQGEDEVVEVPGVGEYSFIFAALPRPAFIQRPFLNQRLATRLLLKLGFLI